MNYLLDTQVFLWAVFNPEELSKPARESVKRPGNDVVVSVVTFWEISLKYALGKLEVFGIEPDDLPEIASRTGFGILTMSPREASTFHKLPRLKHKDPFDRFIIWQAIQNNMTLVSKYREFRAYERFGLRVIW